MILRRELRTGVYKFLEMLHRVQGTLVYRDGAEVDGSLGLEGYPHGTEITFRCIASIMGEKTTWKLICEHGDWVGKSFNCGEFDTMYTLLDLAV